MKSKKKELGQFFTDPIIAEFMVNLLLKKETKTLLDPAVGMGVFTRIAKEYNSKLSVSACEIDPEMIEEFKAENKYDYELYEEDYLQCHFNSEFDAIICNPPYNKFQDIPNRNMLIQDFRMRYNISLSGYSNICVYFLIKSINELKKNGRCCYIIPYEFMNTVYGTIIKKYLLESKMLKSFIKFDNSLSLFNEAITTSCIILIENNTHDTVEFVNISDVKELNTVSFKNVKRYQYSELNPKEKWLQYFDFKRKNNCYNNMVKLSTFGRVSRGIATGANNYFTLNRTMIEENNLSEGVCLPCLTKAPDVKDIVFTMDSFRRLEEQDKRVFLFDGEKAATKNDFAYIKHGEDDGVNKTYLTSHRNPWFAIEKKNLRLS